MSARPEIWLAVVASTMLLALVRVPPDAGGNDAQQAVTSVLSRFDFHKRAASQSELAPQLQEISGLATTSDGRVFAHDDESAVISQISLCSGVIEKSFALGTPALSGDFEGIAIAGERFFLATSGGHLLESREGKNGATSAFTNVKTGFGKLCELEGLAYEPSDRTLLFGCKTPYASALRGQVSILRWSLDRNAPASPDRISVSLAEVERRMGARGFHPSSVERDPATGHYIILAGRERALLEISAAGEIVATQTLHRQLHRQPEGVTLLGDSLLVIADEGAGGRATLTCYRHAR